MGFRLSYVNMEKFHRQAELGPADPNHRKDKRQHLERAKQFDAIDN
jgi:hypothetical protein